MIATTTCEPNSSYDQPTKLLPVPLLYACECPSGQQFKNLFSVSCAGARRWALGVCLFSFVFGTLPFQGTCVLNVHESIRTHPFSVPPEPVISEALRDLLGQLLDKNQLTRPKLKVRTLNT